MNKENRLLEFEDQRYVWHPFTQMKEWSKHHQIIIAEGRETVL